MSRARAESLRTYLPLRERIEAFWRDGEHREAATWRDHRDISRMTLAASLAPSGYLDPWTADARRALRAGGV